MRSLIFISFVFLFIQCGRSGFKQPLQGRVVTYTTIDIAGNVLINEYPRLTARKTVYDTVMNVVIDTSGGKTVQERKQVRDSSYEVWYPLYLTDSTGKKAIRNKANTSDSVVYRFIPVDREAILHDHNKNWHIPFKQ